MAQIEFRIMAINAEDLQQTLVALAGFQGGLRPLPSVQVHEGLNDEDPDAGATQDAEPGERQARKRRTKAEMEAAKSGAGTQEPATSATSKTADVFGDQLKEVAAEAATGITEDSLKDLGRQVFEKVGAAQAQAILMEHGGGQKQFKTVAPEHYAALHAAFVAALEAAGE